MFAEKAFKKDVTRIVIVCSGGETIRQSFRISKLQNVKASECQSFRMSKLQFVADSIFEASICLNSNFLKPSICRSLNLLKCQFFDALICRSFMTLTHICRNINMSKLHDVDFRSFNI